MENGLPHISTTLQCEFLHRCAGLSGDKGAQSACAWTKKSQWAHVHITKLWFGRMCARCVYVGLKTRAYMTHSREWKIQMDFSQFNLELAGWQVHLGRLVHLQVKQIKEEQEKPKWGRKLIPFPSGVANLLCLFHHLSEKNRGACKLSWVCWAGQLQGKELGKEIKDYN